MKIAEVIFKDTGIGSSVRHQQRQTHGLSVKMKPSIFLKLASKMIGSTIDDDSFAYIENEIKKGRDIAPPTLRIQIPAVWWTK